LALNLETNLHTEVPQATDRSNSITTCFWRKEHDAKSFTNSLSLWVRSLK
jgi:hypothetical protein